MTYDPEKWHAVVYDDNGFVFDRHIDGWVSAKADGEDYFESDGEPAEIVIVRGSAVPIPQSKDPKEIFFRGPGSWKSLDRFFEEDVESHTEDQVATIWARAQATAEAMNTAGVE